MPDARGRAFARGAAAVTLVAALLVGATAAAADSEAEPAEWPDGIWLLDHDDPIDPDAVAALAEHEGVSRAEAERRMRIENAVPALKLAAEEADPATFGGVWIDRDPFRVVLAYTTDAQQHVDALAAGFPEPDVVEAATVERARWELRALTATILGERHRLEDGNPPADMPEALVGTGGTYTIWTDVRANAVGISLENPSEALRDAVASRYDPSVVVEDARVVPSDASAVENELCTGLGCLSTCNTESCKGRFVGGVMAIFSGYCTFAFNTYSNGRHNSMSAGHCTANSDWWTRQYYPGQDTDSAYYGPVKNYIFGGRVDAEVIENHAADKQHKKGEPRIVADNGLRDIGGYVSYSNMTVGTNLAKTGATTGTTRGAILRVDVAPSYIPNAHAKFVHTEACIDYGDSGGPVFRSNQVYGINSGGFFYDGNGCGDVGQLIFGAASFAMSAHGESLVTTSDSGPPANPNDPPRADYDWDCPLLSLAVLTCNFDGSPSSDSDGTIVKYRWDWGDGTSSTGRYATHTYAVPGWYDVKLTVTDDDGAKDSESKQITVLVW